jgi:UDP-glucuronate decarboxylase
MLVLPENVLRLVGSKPKFSFYPQPAGDPMQRRPDVSLAKQADTGLEIQSLPRRLAKVHLLAT